MRPTTATTPDAIRDQLAEAMGWKKYPEIHRNAWRRDGDKNCHHDENSFTHPIEWSLDFIAAALPPGRYVDHIHQCDGQWRCRVGKEGFGFIRPEWQPDEITARALACLAAWKQHKEPA